MKKYKKILFGILLAIVVLFIAPFLVPTQSYLQKAERVASEKLGAPVTITSGYLRFLPSPRLVASNIIVGKNQDVVIGKLIIVPTLSTLFSETKQIRLVLLKPVIKKEVLTIISALSADKSENAESAAINISKINVEEMRLIWPDIELPIFNAEITLTEENHLDAAVVESLDGKLKAEAVPKGDAHLITLNARKWILPASLPLLLDSAMIEMRLKDNELTVPKIDVALYGGKLAGDALFTWQKNKGVTNWKSNGRLTIENLSVKEPSMMMSKAVYLSGSLFGDGHFSASAKDVGQLAERLQANFKFKMNNGVLHGLDLVKVASLLIKQNQNGGQTQFDAFSGLLNVSGKQYHLKDLKISSGLLAAKGQVKVKPNKELDGAVDVELKHSVSLVSIPLEVSGTVRKPVVLPSKAALAGAAVGTAILGPGVGTSLGVKAAGALDSIKEMFSGD